MQLLRVIVKWRRFLYVNTIIIVVVGLILALVSPPQFESVGKVLPITEQPSVGVVGMQIPYFLMATMGGVSTPNQLFVEILNSRPLRISLAKKLDLFSYYRTSDTEKILEKLDNAVSVSTNLTGVVTIKAKARDPKMAKKLVDGMIALLDSFNRNNVMYQGKKLRIMLEKRLAELEKNMKEAEESLAVFQARHKTIAITDEWTAFMDEYAKLKEKEIEYSIRLNILEEVATPDHPEVQKLKRDLRGVRKELEKFESLGQSGFGPGFSVPLEKVPWVSIELARRMRDVEVYNQIYAYVVQQLEQARILEKKDTPTLQVIEPGGPGKKIWPKKSSIGLGSLLMGIFLSLFFAAFMEFRERIEVDPQLSSFRDLIRGLERDLFLR
jgi:uncharacterized protein involved in exopolysaccharide biosynthesis